MRNLILFLQLCLFITISHQAFAAETRIKMATTTSTENSGLLTVLNPPFQEKYDVKLDVIAVGTGKAIRLGQNGDVDLILAHAPEAEKKFVAEGYGIEREPVMHNDFIIVGPANDPAGIKDAENVTDAMAKIMSSNNTFVSRDDDSGTHKKEKSLWEKVEKKPGGDWYLSVGQGMGVVLRIADDKEAYTLTDRGTYLAYKDKMKLRVLFENDPLLFNPYHVIMANPEKHPHTKIDMARKYSEFIRGEEGQTLIRNFKVNGDILFYPDVIP